MKPLSLYIHIPFCQTKCTYCAFNTYTNLSYLIDSFVTALTRELITIGEANPEQPIHTVYIGGGTPSQLDQQQIEQILGVVAAYFELVPNAEVSMESNPSDLSRPYLNMLRKAGINRLSIGMQSANGQELGLFARRHDLKAVLNAMEAARASGFDNINLDLIYGIPNQLLTQWRYSLDTVLALKPKHISLYALGLEEGTSLHSWVSQGRLPQPDDDLTADMYEMATDMLGTEGYEQYEISNWSKPRYECQHNLQYWRNLTYVGAGPGAHGCARGIRYSNVLSPQRYIKIFNEPIQQIVFPLTPAADQYTIVDCETDMAETLILGLRLTREGIIRNNFMERFGIDPVDLHQQTFRQFVECGLLSVDNSTVRLTRKGRLLSNVIFRDLV